MPAESGWRPGSQVPSAGRVRAGDARRQTSKGAIVVIELDHRCSVPLAEMVPAVSRLALAGNDRSWWRHGDAVAGAAGGRSGPSPFGVGMLPRIARSVPGNALAVPVLCSCGSSVVSRRSSMPSGIEHTSSGAPGWLALPVA